MVLQFHLAEQGHQLAVVMTFAKWTDTIGVGTNIKFNLFGDKW